MSIDMQAQIRGYVAQIEEDQAPIGPDEVLALVKSLPGPDPSAAPARVERRWIRRYAERGWRYGLAAAVVALLLVGGVAWLSRSSQPDSADQSTTITTASPTSTTVTPDLEGEPSPLEVVDQGTTGSPLGEVRWIVLEGDSTGVPDAIVSSAAGLASLSHDGRLLVSSDGEQWSAVASPVPGELRSIEVHRGFYVLEAVTGDGEQHLWESIDLASWAPAEVGVPAGATPSLSGLAVRTELATGAVVSAVGATLTEWDSRVWVDWHEIAVRADAGSQERVEYPWPDHDNEAHLAGTDDGFVAARRVGNHDSPFRLEVWRSADGRSWENVGLAASSASGDPQSFAERDGVMIVSFGHTDDVSRYGILRSEDGITWEPPRDPPVPTGEDLVDEFGNVLFNATGEAYALPSGWVWLSGSDTDFAMWTSVDGDTWEQAALGGIPVPFWAQLEDPLEGGDRSGTGQWGASGDLLYITQFMDEPPGPSTAWIFNFGS